MIDEQVDKTQTQGWVADSVKLDHRTRSVSVKQAKVAWLDRDMDVRWTAVGERLLKEEDRTMIDTCVGNLS